MAAETNESIKLIEEALKCDCVTTRPNINQAEPTVYRFRYYGEAYTIEFSIHKSNLTIKMAVSELMEKQFERGKKQGEKDFKGKIRDMFDINQD